MSMKSLSQTAAFRSLLLLVSWLPMSAQGVAYFSFQPTPKERQELKARAKAPMAKTMAGSALQAGSAALPSAAWGDWKTEAFWQGTPAQPAPSGINLDIPTKSQWNADDRVGDTRQKANRWVWRFNVWDDTYFCVRFDMKRVVTNEPLPRSDGDYLPAQLYQTMMHGGTKPLMSAKADIDLFFNGKLGAKGELCLGVPYELEVVQFNDVPITGHRRTARVGQLLREHLEVDTSSLRFPTLPVQEDGTPKEDGTPTPAWNMVMFRVNFATIGWRGPSGFHWACEEGSYFCADAELQYKAIAPIFLVHGTNAQRDTWTEPTGDSFITYYTSQWGRNANQTYPAPWSNAIDIQNKLHGNGSIKASGLELETTILPRLLKRYGAKYCHIIAHSKGGSDSRECIRLLVDEDAGRSRNLYIDNDSKLGYHYRILSLYTLDTPHRGTVLADISYQNVEAMQFGVRAMSLNLPIMEVLNCDTIGRILGSAGLDKANPVRAYALSDQQTGEMEKRWGLEGQKVANYLRDNNGKLHFVSTAGDADANNDYVVDSTEAAGIIPPLLELSLRPGLCMYQTLGKCVSVKTTQKVTRIPLLSLFYVEPVNLPSGLFIPNDMVVAVTSAIGPGAIHRQLPPFAVAKPPFEEIYIAKNHSAMKNVNIARTLWEDILYDYPDFVYAYPE